MTSTERETRPERYGERKGGRRKEHTHAKQAKENIARKERGETYLSFRRLGFPTGSCLLQRVGRASCRSHVSPSWAAHNQGFRREVLGVARARRSRKGRRRRH
jgi:hypothetical protein